MKVLFLVVGAGAAFFLYHGWQGSPSPASSIREVGKLLETASKPHPTGRWIDQMNGACAQREQRLAGLTRPAVLDGRALAAHSARVLAIHRAYAERVRRVRAPARYQADLRQIRAFNAAQLQLLARVGQAARSSGVGSAASEALALRELAGRANPVFLRLGLDRCALRSSGMPL
jgi:hypothetical protein